MAIQPIDLSTMYSQMDKVAKFSASQDQNAQLSNSVNMNKTVQENLEKTKEVHQAAADKPEAVKVRPDGKQQTQLENRKGKQQKDGEQKEEEAQKKAKEIVDPLLGQHIDITR